MFEKMSGECFQNHGIKKTYLIIFLCLSLESVIGLETDLIMREGSYIAPDKITSEKYFSYFSMKTYVVGTH